MLHRLWMLLICFLSLSTTIVRGQDTPKYQEIAQIGRPSIQTIDWNPQQDLIAVATTKDIWLYDTELKDVTHFDLALAINLTQWETKGTMQPIRIWRISAAKWSPNGRWLTIKISILTVDGVWQPDVWQIWDWDGTTFKQVIPEQLQFLSEIKWSPNESQYALTSGDKVYLFDATSNKNLKQFQAVQVVWSNDNQYLAVVASASIQVLDAQSLNLEATFFDNDSKLRIASWSYDNTKLAAIGDNRLYVWDIPTQKRLVDQINMLPSPYPEMGTGLFREPIRAIAWRPNSDELVISYASMSTTQYGRFSIWNVIGNREISSLPEAGNLIAMQWTPDGSKLIATGVTNFKFVELYDMSFTPPKLQQNFPSTEQAYDKSQKQLIGYSSSRNIFYLLDPNSLVSLKTLGSFATTIRAVSWSPDNQRIVAASRDEIQIWNLTTNNLLADNTQHIGRFVYLIGWNHDNDKFALISSDPSSRFSDFCNSIRVWDINQEDMHTLATANYDSNAVWNPTNNQLAILERNFPDSNCQREPSLRIFDTNSQKELLTQPNSEVYSFEWSTQGTPITYTLRSNRLSINDIQSGQTLHTIPVPPNLSTFVWIPDNNMILASSVISSSPKDYKYEFVVLDANTGNVLLSMPNIQHFSLAHNHKDIALSDDSGGIEIGSITRTENTVLYSPHQKLAKPKATIFGMWWNNQDTEIATLGTSKPIGDEIQTSSLQIWNLQESNNPQSISTDFPLGSEGSIEDFVWNPDGKQFAISLTGGSIQIWSQTN